MVDYWGCYFQIVRLLGWQPWKEQIGVEVFFGAFGRRHALDSGA